MKPLWWETLTYPEAHGVHVATLSEQLFTLTASRHHLGTTERNLLSMAALLHDIGQSVSMKHHHKHSFHLILDHGLPGLSKKETLMVALIARYHRKAEPQMTHHAFAGLSVTDRRIVRTLASLIRLADGMDRSYGGVIRRISLKVQGPLATFTLVGEGGMSEELSILPKKATLFEQVFHVHTTFIPSAL